MADQTDTTIDISALQSWVGRHEVHRDVITQAPINGLSAALDYPAPRATTGTELPQPWHWLYFLPAAAASDIDLDGHPKRGGFLPPVPLPRRMWASSSMDFVAPLLVGDAVKRVSTIKDISLKQGSTGQLVFVSLEHETFVGQQLAIREQQNLVYRETTSHNRAPPPAAAPAEPQWSRQVTPDPVLLFRYSALTFNGHRIHYDRDYATGEEGYSGLVVQGPLIATLLLDLLFRKMAQAKLASFRFRGVSPLVVSGSFQVQGRCDGKQVQLWALSESGFLAMAAEAVLV